jgi:uncharacterized protein DUF6876
MPIMRRPTNDTRRRLTVEDLASFHGSENFHRHSPSGLIYTDGVKFIADRAGAYWLIDAIASYQGRGGKLARDPMLRDYQIWKLTVNEDQTAVITCQADSGMAFVVNQKIEYTDFPLSSLRLTVERGGHYDAAGQVVSCMTCMLPSER